MARERQVVKRIVEDTLVTLTKKLPQIKEPNQQSDLIRNAVNLAFNNIQAKTDVDMHRWYLAYAYLLMLRAVNSQNITKASSLAIQDQDVVSFKGDEATGKVIYGCLCNEKNRQDFVADRHRSPSVFRHFVYFGLVLFDFFKKITDKIIEQDKNPQLSSTEEKIELEKLKINFAKSFPLINLFSPLLFRFSKYPAPIRILLAIIGGLICGPLILASAIVYLLALFSSVLLTLSIGSLTFNELWERLSTDMENQRNMLKTQCDDFKQLLNTQHMDDKVFYAFLLGLKDAEKGNKTTCLFAYGALSQSSESYANEAITQSGDLRSSIYEYLLTPWKNAIIGFFECLQADFKNRENLLSLPIRAFLGSIALLLMLVIALAACVIMAALTLCTIAITGVAVTLYSVFGLPHYIAEKRWEFLSSFGCVAGAVALAAVVFGLNPLILGIVAGAGCLTSLALSHSQLNFFVNPAAKVAIGVTIACVGIFLAVAIFSPIPIPVITPFLLAAFSQIAALIPTSLPLQLLIAAGVGIGIVAIPTIITGLAAGVAKLFSCVKKSDGKLELEKTELNKVDQNIPSIQQNSSTVTPTSPSFGSPISQLTGAPSHNLGASALPNAAIKAGSLTL